MLHIVTKAARGRGVLFLHDEGCHGARCCCEHGVEAHVHGVSVCYLHEIGAQARHDACHEEAGELVADGYASIAHLSWEEIREQCGLGAKDAGIEDAQGDDDRYGNEKEIATACFHNPEGGEDGDAAQKA